MLTQSAGLSECHGGSCVVRASILVPAPYLQQVDFVLACHEVNVTAAQVFRQILVLSFRIQAYDIHSRFTHDAENQF